MANLRSRKSLLILIFILSHLYKGNLISLSLSIGEDEQGTMYTPYRPNLTDSLFTGGLKGAGRGSLRQSLSGIKSRIGPAIRSVFKSGNKSNIKRYMKGAPKKTIKAAQKNPDKAADALGDSVASYVVKTRGTAMREGAESFYESLPRNLPEEATELGGVVYAPSDVAPFYDRNGALRKIEFQPADRMGDIGGNQKWLKRDSSPDSGMEKFFDRLSTAPADDALSGNPIQKNLDDLVADGGKLSDEGLDEAAQEIAKGSKASGAYKEFGESFENSLKGVNPKSILDDSVDDIVERAKNPVPKETSGFQKGVNTLIIGTFTVAVGAYLIQGFTDNLLAALGIIPNCREEAEATYPDDPVKQDEYVEECLDRAARNVAYLGAAAVGIGGLVLLVIVTRLVPKRKS